jgi:hypothetical protein
MRPLSLILAVFGALGGALGQALEYDIHIDHFQEQGDMLSADAFVRLGGEAHTKIRILSPPGSPTRTLFESKRQMGDLEFSYFRIRTETEIPAALPVRPAPSVDVVTKEVLADFVLNAKYRSSVSPAPEWDGHLNLFPLKDDQILEIREIRQNDFLGIQPRIVSPK